VSHRNNFALEMYLKLLNCIGSLLKEQPYNLIKS
jgi:hypothetical protein